MKQIVSLHLAGVLVALGACAPAADKSESTPAAETPAGQPELANACDASKLDDAVGQMLTVELQKKLQGEAKAEIVRVAPHDGAITMDYNHSRLNIFVDDAKNIIRINCG
jgi:Peptidase inhibitor I78 family